MINNIFRDQLEKVVVFIFDNEKEFMKKFILELLAAKLKNNYKSIEKVISTELENVFISNSRVFIRIKYFYDSDEKDSLDREEMDFFLDSNEIFDWVNDFVIKKQKVNQDMKMVVDLSIEDRNILDFICDKVKISEKEKIILSIILKFKKIQSSCIAHKSKGMLKINNIYGQLTRLVKKGVIVQTSNIHKIGEVGYKVVFNKINEKALKVLD